MAVDLDNDRYVEIRQETDEIHALSFDAGNVSVVGSATYDSVEHRWGRLREDAGITHWEISPNGADWRKLASAPNPIPMNAVDVSFGMTVDVMRPPGTAVFSHYNLPP